MELIERWKPVIGYEQLYEVSSLGNVKNKKGKILKPSKSTPYNQVTLIGKDKRKRSFTVHRLVAIAFIPNPNGYLYINHKDEDKRNNIASNLEWCTCQYNNTYGEGAKARNRKVIQKTYYGKTIRNWESMKEAAETLGIKYQGISRCCRGLKKHSGGFMWEYGGGTG